ncbi:NAD(P)/FAD-dependent oxidoreductase [Saccharospirillum mangrovi]|uniref:NAD(P)/FAD-dependent oxidoreductase n=1 Tax=Saccharospirillum mangrovi TaxID=2161747 RepID=UPI000D382A82|nr:NAD(P)/FAD-dependent oxidoreductase [Saccharospirillum mangrovi]
MNTTYDVVIVGGSYAGMAAAMMLARGYRTVLMIDGGQRRNRFASHAHGVIGDGKPPGQIADEAREQLLKYPSVTWVNGLASTVQSRDGVFKVETDSGEQYSGLYLILATGVRDELPDIPGLNDGWGKTVFHCPYCHGYELNRGALGVLASSEESFHQAFMIPDWGLTTFFINGVFEPSADQLNELRLRGVTVEREVVTRVSGETRAVVHLADGREVDLAGLFVAPKMTMTNTLAEQLGCVLTEGTMGSYIEVDAMQATSVPGVFACGDAARPFGNVTFAMAGGAMAGSAVHRSLMHHSIMQSAG